MKRPKNNLLCLVIALTITLAPSLLFLVSARSAALNERDPILIEGDAGFTAANGVVAGSGTLGDPFVIEGWDIDASIMDGIKVRNTSAFFVIRNCLVRNAKNRFGGGIYFENVVNGKIENVKSDNNWDAIHLVASSGNVVRGCSAENSRRGIFLDYASRNAIEGCSFQNNNAGIVLLSSEFNTIKNCIISDDNTGILLTFSKNNEVRACTVFKNKIGIFLESSSGNVVYGCIVENSSFGGIAVIPVVGREPSDNNRIYHNNFLNNPNQAYENGSNYWDNGYPSGGNYWSDYVGVDNYRGENQDIPGKDGIGDTPYNIPGGAGRDRYPLMSQFVRRAEVSALSILPELVGIGEPLEISVDVKNEGDLEITYEVILKINGAIEAVENVRIAGGGRETVMFTVARNEEGIYNVEVDGLMGTFTVVKTVSKTEPYVLWIIIGIVAASGMVALVYKRRKH